MSSTSLLAKICWCTWSSYFIFSIPSNCNCWLIVIVGYSWVMLWVSDVLCFWVRCCFDSPTYPFWLHLWHAPSNIIKLHYLPSSIINNHDIVFIIPFCMSFFALSHPFQHCMLSQLNNQTELINCCTVMNLHYFTNARPRQCLNWFPWVDYLELLNLNATPSMLSLVIPHQGYYPTMLIPNLYIILLRVGRFTWVLSRQG